MVKSSGEKKVFKKLGIVLFFFLLKSFSDLSYAMHCEYPRR